MFEGVGKPIRNNLGGEISRPGTGLLVGSVKVEFWQSSLRGQKPFIGVSELLQYVDLIMLFAGRMVGVGNRPDTDRGPR